jgi:predicted  nucleic acid-binding Zn-ribbon protein
MVATARLLELQAIDSAIDRLEGRRRALEAGDALADARARADAAENAYGELRLRLDVFDRDASRFEHEIDSISQKAAAEERRLFDGSIANAKELESLQREVENLRKRKADREDELLILMEQREEVERSAAQSQREATELRRVADDATGDATEELARVAAELTERRAEREAVVPSIDPELLELYEDLRRQKKGVGAAALTDGVCQGCHEQLSAVEVDKLKRVDGVPRCEHCRRILIL